MNTAGRIDTHAHIVPGFYRDWLGKRQIESGGYPLPEWDAGRALAFMDDHAIAASILSVSAPGVTVAPGAEAAAMARQLNEYSAEVVRSFPSRFGFFSTVWQSDMDATLKEVDHSLDELQADGVVLPTNSGRSYLGSKEFEPLLAELDRRSATVFVHPTDLANSSGCEIPSYVADFLLDTVRAAVNLAHCGALDRYPSIRWILAHGGGFLPYAALRISSYASPRGSARDGIERLKSFYLDTALASSDYSLPSLRAFAEQDRIVYGSDYPFAPTRVIENYTSTLQRSFDVNETRRICRDNAAKLLPGLMGRMAARIDRQG